MRETQRRRRLMWPAGWFTRKTSGFLVLPSNQPETPYRKETR